MLIHFFFLQTCSNWLTSKNNKAKLKRPQNTGKYVYESPLFQNFLAGMPYEVVSEMPYQVMSEMSLDSG